MGRLVDPITMQFDPIITNPGRLTILTALCDQATRDFVSLRKATRLTDGNLTTHARKLAGAGMVTIEKSSREGKPVTYITLTSEGKNALKRHVENLTQSVIIAATSPEPELHFAPTNEQEQGAWID